MTVTSNNDTKQRTPTVLVAVRVAHGGNKDLVTDAEHRLACAEGVVQATIDELHEIEPTLSATRLIATVTIELTTSLSIPELRNRLAGAPGVEVLDGEHHG